MRTVAAFAVILMVCKPSFAEDCSDLSHVSVAECPYPKYKEADVKLNQAYRAAQSRLTDASRKTKFVEAQRKWIMFRDAECLFRSSGLESPVSHVYEQALYSYMAEITEQRTKMLETYLDCKEDGCELR